MAGLKKPTILRQSSINSLYSNPLVDTKNNQNCNEQSNEVVNITGVTPLGAHLSFKNNILSSKENNPIMKTKKNSSFVADEKENLVPHGSDLLGTVKKNNPDEKSLQNSKERTLKPSSLQLCIQMNEPDSSFGFGCKVWDAADETESSKSVNLWDYSDSEAAPVASWSTLPNSFV